MTTIGSTNPYYASSLWGISPKNGGSQDNGGDYTAPRQSQAGGGITGRDPAFGAKLAETIWTMESQGVEIAQEAGNTWLGKPPRTDVSEEFLEMAKKTFAERIRDQFLEDRDLTEADLAAMSPEDRAAVEKEIRNAILEAMGVNEDTHDAAMNAGAPQDAGNVATQVASPAAGRTDAGGEDDPLLSM